MLSKIRSKFLVGILFTIIFLIIIAVCISQINYYRISPTTAIILGTNNPVEFCETRGKNTLLENGYTYARVDNDGYLRLILTDKEVDNLKNSYYPLSVLQCVLGDEKNIGVVVDMDNDELGLLEKAATCGFEISDDFKTVKESPDDNGWYFLFVVPGCAMMQMLEGVSDVRVNYYEVDYDGTVLKSDIWPVPTEETIE